MNKYIIIREVVDNVCKVRDRAGQDDFDSAMKEGYIYVISHKVSQSSSGDDVRYARTMITHAFVLSDDKSMFKSLHSL